jgi:glutamine---fructose-6-phosphate transaminase (isomerizing)
MKSLGNFPDPFIAEIGGQPDALRRAAVGIQDQAATLDEILRRGAGRTVVFTGMGSSYDACYPAVAELARARIAAIHVDSAELLHFRSRMLGPHVLLVAVSQSGESAEVVRLVERTRTGSDGPIVVAVTNGSENRLASIADQVVDTRAGIETGPSTMTFAASLVAVAAIGRTLAERAPAATIEALPAQAELAAVAIERMLADPGLPERLARWLDDRTTLVILGRGPARAASEMGALTIKEAVGMPVESLQTAQFRHGPLELAGPDLAAIVIATESETAELDVSLGRELAGAGAGVLLVTASGDPGEVGASADAGVSDANHLDIGPVDRILAPAVSIVPVQLLAWRLSVLRGRTPGAYYRAAKVTTRE